jgi:3-oxoacyl-[acyl-carrier protein] reductase
MDLNGATALITGGSSGIGFAIAQTLAAAGTRVAVTGRNRQRLAEAARSLRALSVCADVSNEDDVKRTYDEVLGEFGTLDILVNSAGFGLRSTLVDMDRAKFDAVFQTNVTGTMLMGREAARHFIARQRGNIVNLGSTAAVHGAPRGTAYYASKFAVRGMTECWRAELRPHNIRVFLINPSEVLTQFAANAGFSQDDGDPTKLQAEDIAHVVKGVLEMNDRGFTIETTILATNPSDLKKG